MNMIYLKTHTSELTIPHIRRIVCETIRWCETNMGTKRKKSPLTYKVSYGKIHPIDVYGLYDPTSNQIKLHLGLCHDVRTLIKVTLHEYTHFLQNLRGYDKMLREVGYKNHPQEIEARESEMMFSQCWKQIKSVI